MTTNPKKIVGGVLLRRRLMMLGHTVEETEIPIGVNLLDPSKVVTNKYLNTDGTEVMYLGWYCSNYIPIKAGQTYKLTKSDCSYGGAWIHGLWYDSEKTRIMHLPNGGAGEYILTPPAGACYIRITWLTPNDDTLVRIS